MLRWMCGITKRIKTRYEYVTGPTRVTQASKTITESVFDEKGRRTHIVKSVLMTDIPGRRKSELGF